MIFLGLGSNIGNKRKHLENALNLMSGKNINVVRYSSFYRSPPWGIVEQDSFLNMVCEVSSKLSPIELLDAIQDTELEMGRIRDYKWGPRIIDIDILEFNKLQFENERLQIPHPYYPKRAFVLVPFIELEPDWIPTGYKQTLGELLGELPDRDTIIKLD